MYSEECVNTIHPIRVCFAIALSALLSGCDSGPKQYKVSGKVSYQGEPVAEGDIFFAASDGASATAAGKIHNGRYELLTTAGKKTVRITASRETGKIIEGAMDQKFSERVDLIPAKYNTASTLERTVDPSAGLTIDFELE